MLRFHTRFAFVFFLLALSWNACSQSTAPSTQVISACVGKIGGITRIVKKQSECLKDLETFLQWDVQGPAGPQGAAGVPGPVGPTGPQGAQGPAGPAGGATLPHIILVAATSDPYANGRALLDALTASSIATAANPILIQLEPGTYQLPSLSSPLGVPVPNYVGIKGAGMLLTKVINPNDRVNSGYGIFAFGQSGSLGAAVNTLSDMTLMPLNYAIANNGPVTLELENVHVTGGGWVIIPGESALVPTSIRVVNSIVDAGMTALMATSPSTLTITAIGSRVFAFSFQSVGGATTYCFGSYNYQNVLYNTTCQ